VTVVLRVPSVIRKFIEEIKYWLPGRDTAPGRSGTRQRGVAGDGRGAERETAVGVVGRRGRGRMEGGV